MSRATAQREDGLVAAPQQRVAGSRSPPGLTSPLTRASNRTDTLCRTSSFPQPSPRLQSQDTLACLELPTVTSLELGGKSKSSTPFPEPGPPAQRDACAAPPQPAVGYGLPGGQERGKTNNRDPSWICACACADSALGAALSLRSKPGGGKIHCQVLPRFLSWQDGPEQNVFGSLLAPD